MNVRIVIKSVQYQLNVSKQISQPTKKTAFKARYAGTPLFYCNALNKINPPGTQRQNEVVSTTFVRCENGVILIVCPLGKALNISFKKKSLYMKRKPKTDRNYHRYTY